MTTIRFLVGGLLAASLFAGEVAGQQPGERAISPPGEVVQSASAHEAVGLDELVQEALEKNPGLRSIESRVAALRARVTQAKSLPDPKVSVGWMGNILPFDVQTGDPSSYRAIGASQDLPYPGKLKLRGEIAGSEAEAAWWDRLCGSDDRARRASRRTTFRLSSSSWTPGGHRLAGSREPCGFPELAKIRVDYGEHVVVPSEAVLDSGMRQIVFIARPGGYFEPREIKVGARVDQKYVVLEGLKPGEKIVTSGNFLIDSESRLSAATGDMSHKH